MKGLFVTGSGTEVGKTYVTCRLLRAQRAAGRACRAVKPVASGFDPHDLASTDSGKLLEAMGCALTIDAAKRISPWRFEAPLSPDMAAAREGRCVPFDELIAFCRAELSTTGPTLIEGIGGVMVPLDASHTVLDWIDSLRLPVLLVAGSYVGTLSHTLTAASVLETRGITLAAVVVSETADSAATLDETVHSLQRFLPAARIFGVPRGAATHGGCSELEGYLLEYLD